MSTSWNQFHSDFLNTLHREYGGIFHGKFLGALEKFQDQKDLRQMVFSMFPHEEMEVQEPTAESLKMFDLGNVGNDTVVLMYLNKKVSEILQLILQQTEDPQLPLVQANIVLSLIQSSETRSSTLARYAALFQFLALSSSGSREDLSFDVQNAEDLSFCGVLTLLSAVFTKENISTPFIDSNFNYSGSDEGNALNIDPSILLEIREASDRSAIDRWLYLNRGAADLRTSRLPIRGLLPSVLNDSSFLWKNELLEVSPENVEAMSQEERILTLIRNKSSIISNCFKALKPYIKTTQRTNPTKLLDLKNSLMKMGAELTALLGARSQKLQKLSQEESKAREIKTSLVGLAEMRGGSQKDAAARIFQLLGKRELPQMEMLSPEEAILYKSLQNYQKALFKKSVLTQDLKDITQEINEKIGELEGGFQAIIKKLRENDFIYFARAHHLLEVYATFSFIVLNKDLFPSLPLKGEVKKKGAKRILQLAEKFKEKRAFSKWRGEGLERSPIFQEMMNAQLERIYAAYDPENKSYTGRELTEEEIDRISNISEKIESEADAGDKTVIDKFVRFEKVLEKILLEDRGFSRFLGTIRNREKNSSLQAHLEAALLFAQAKDTSAFTGVSNAEGFERIFNSILSSISDEGIKEKSKSDVKELIKSAQSLIPLNKDSMTKELFDEINRKSYRELARTSAELVSVGRSEYVNNRIQIRQNIYDQLKDYFQEQIYGNNRRWLKTYEGVERMFNSLPLDGELPNFQSYLTHSFPLRNLFPPTENLMIRNPQEKNELKGAFQRFFQENGFKLSTLEGKPKSSLWQTPVEEDIALMAIPWIANQLKDQIKQLEFSESRYRMMPNNDPLTLQFQADVFANQTIFKFMSERRRVSEEDSGRVFRAYQDFLPIFISSFVVADNSEIFGFMREPLNEQKMKLLGDLPGADTTYREIKEYFQKNRRSIQDINTYLRNEIESAQSAGIITDDPQTWSTFFESKLEYAKQKLQQSLSPIVSGIAWQGVTTVVVFVAITKAWHEAGLLRVAMPLGFSPFSWILATAMFLGFGINHILPSTFTGFFTSIFRKLKALTETQEFSPGAPSKMLLETMETGVSAEISTIDDIQNISHRLNLGLYLQELMGVLEESQHNLLSFSTRISGLIAPDTKQTNVSIQALNMFYMLNKDLFLILPGEMLENCGGSDFNDAAINYLEMFNWKISQEGRGFSGEKTLSLDHHTPYWEYLNSRNITLDFPENSPVGRFFGRPISFNVLGDQIVNLRFDPRLLLDNLNEFRRSSKKILESREHVQHKMAKILNALQKSYNKPLSTGDSANLLSLIPFFEMVRYGLGVANKFTEIRSGNVDDPFSNWLEATGENAESVLSSNLFQSALSMLKLFASTCASLEIPEGHEMLRVVKRINDEVSRYLENRTGALNLPSFTDLQELKDSLVALVDHRAREVPAIAYPLLVALESNKDNKIAVILWNHFKRSVSPQSIDLLNNSRELYLTNSELEIFNSPEGRGFLCSTFLINALQTQVHNHTNKALLKFLSQAQASTNAIARSENPSPRRYDLPFMTPSYARQQNQAAIQADPEAIAPSPLTENTRYAAPGASWLQPTSRNQIDPGFGVSPQQYDPQNTGLNPVQSLATQQGGLPEGVESKLRAGMHNQRALMPAAPTGSQRQVPAIEQRGTDGLVAPALMMGQIPVEQNAPAQEIAPMAQEAEQPIMIGVDAEGRSMSRGVGGSGGDNSSFGRALADNRDQQEIGGIIDQGNKDFYSMQGDSFPDIGNEPYVNTLMQNYNPSPDPFPWKKALLGGGLALGAGLLGKSLFYDDRSKKKGDKK